METEVVIINPIEFIEKRLRPDFKEYNNCELDVKHITYSDDINKIYDYRIIRSVTHDGTLIFTHNRIIDVLTPLLQKRSYCKTNIPKDLKTIKDVKYTIGDIILESVFGMYNINGMNMYGQKDIITLPVKVEYVLK